MPFYDFSGLDIKDMGSVWTGGETGAGAMGYGDYISWGWLRIDFFPVEGGWSAGCEYISGI